MGRRMLAFVYFFLHAQAVEVGLPPALLAVEHGLESTLDDVPHPGHREQPRALLARPGVAGGLGCSGRVEGDAARAVQVQLDEPLLPGGQHGASPEPSAAARSIPGTSPSSPWTAPGASSASGMTEEAPARRGLPRRRDAAARCS